MNYYERMQKSIDFIEDNLAEDITVEQCAREAFMSVSSYYRMFLSVVGYNIKEYIRMRRLSLAYDELKQGKSVMTVSTRYGYNSVDSFTRGTYDRVKRRVLSGGKFAVMSVKGILRTISERALCLHGSGLVHG